jgi:hypothetical protein
MGGGFLSNFVRRVLGLPTRRARSRLIVLPSHEVHLLRARSNLGDDRVIRIICVSHKMNWKPRNDNHRITPCSNIVEAHVVINIENSIVKRAHSGRHTSVRINLVIRDWNALEGLTSVDGDIHV